MNPTLALVSALLFSFSYEAPRLVSQTSDGSATWGDAFKTQVERCWKRPYGGNQTQQIEAFEGERQVIAR